MELVVLAVVAFLMAAAMRGAAAVQFKAINKATTTPGGIRFDREITLDHSRYVLRRASFFVLKTFDQTKADRKLVKRVTLIVEPMDGIAFEVDGEVHLSSNYVAGYNRSSSLRAEIEGILYHEVTHVWQWAGGVNETVPSGLIEGIADFVRLRAGYAPAHWVKAGEGERWDQGYDVTARFLDYCDGLPTGINGSFVARLNRAMRLDYSEQLFVWLLGKTVDALWKDYKALYKT